MTTEERDAVLNVFAQMVRPLMRLAVNYGISAREILQVIRRVYVDDLERQFVEKGRAVTDGRLAIFSGLTRAEVSAAREELRAGGPRTLTLLDQISTLLTVWHTDNKFVGAYGIPHDLNRHKGSSSSRLSFSDLISVACPGADEELLLEQLLAAGTVEFTEAQTVRCSSRAYVPKGADDVARIERVGRYLAVHADNFVHNLLRHPDEPAYLERVVTSDEVLSNEARDEFLKVASEKGQELLTELDSTLRHLYASTSDSAGKKYGVGLFFFEEAAANGSRTRTIFEGNKTQNDMSGASGEAGEIDVLAHGRRHE